MDKRQWNIRTSPFDILYRVWPDETIQYEEDEPYDWKSDDYALIYACDADHALEIHRGMYDAIG
jgi:hypothetical protein